MKQFSLAILAAVSACVMAQQSTMPPVFESTTLSTLLSTSSHPIMHVEHMLGKGKRAVTEMPKHVDSTPVSPLSSAPVSKPLEISNKTESTNSSFKVMSQSGRNWEQRQKRQVSTPLPVSASQNVQTSSGSNVTSMSNYSVSSGRPISRKEEAMQGLRQKRQVTKQPIQAGILSTSVPAHEAHPSTNLQQPGSMPLEPSLEGFSPELLQSSTPVSSIRPKREVTTKGVESSSTFFPSTLPHRFKREVSTQQSLGVTSPTQASTTVQRMKRDLSTPASIATSSFKASTISEPVAIPSKEMPGLGQQSSTMLPRLKREHTTIQQSLSSPIMPQSTVAARQQRDVTTSSSTTGHSDSSTMPVSILASRQKRQATTQQQMHLGNASTPSPLSSAAAPHKRGIGAFSLGAGDQSELGTTLKPTANQTVSANQTARAKRELSTPHPLSESTKTVSPLTSLPSTSEASTQAIEVAETIRTLSFTLQTEPVGVEQSALQVTTPVSQAEQGLGLSTSTERMLSRGPRQNLPDRLVEKTSGVSQTAAPFAPEVTSQAPGAVPAVNPKVAPTHIGA